MLRFAASAPKKTCLQRKWIVKDPSKPKTDSISANSRSTAKAAAIRRRREEKQGYCLAVLPWLGTAPKDYYLDSEAPLGTDY